MRVLVTGSDGFIGGHLTRRLLDDGHEVVRLDLKRSEAEDIRRSPLPGAMHATHCVHLAAIAAPNVCASDPGNAWSTNVHGTHNVLRLCHQSGIRRAVFMSSAHVYGISPRYLPTDEQHHTYCAPHDVYTATKIAGESLCHGFYNNHGLSYCALRLFNAYGVRQSKEYFIGRKIAEAKAGGPVVMRTKVEDVTKDWVAVSDVVDAIVRALHSDYVGPLNVGTGRETRLKDIATRIAEAFGVPLVPEDSDDPGPNRMCADPGRIRRTLGWEPKVDFATGLAELIAAERSAAR